MTVAGLVPSAAAALVAVIVGLVVGWRAALAVLIAAHLAIAAYHLYWLRAMIRWAESGPDEAVPEGRGVWRGAFSALYRRVRARAAHQRELAAALEGFRGAADALPDGIVVLDGRDLVEWANRRAHAHLGVTERDRGRPLANVARHPELVRYLSARDYSAPLVVDSMREGGVTLSIQLVPFGFEERLLISRDITTLQAVERMRRDFIANVSHELKTPLTVIAGFIETLQDLDLDAAAQARFLELMQAQARSMQRVVDDLLTLSALESEGNEVAETPFAVESLLGELDVEGRAISAGAHDIVLAPGPPAVINGSRDELRSAFANLVSNAVRYTPAGGCIRLGWEVGPRGEGLFSVSDTGIGIAPEHLPRLTERFYRVDRSRSRATGGTGLGLAIVKHVLLRHQAELLIKSEPGKGSTFAVRLPPERVQVRDAAVAGATRESAPAVSGPATPR